MMRPCGGTSGWWWGCSARRWCARRGRKSWTWSSGSGRGAARTGPPRLRLLDSLDIHSSTRLVRAFVAYFRLANVTEQVHRGRAIRAGRPAGGWLATTAAAVRDAGVSRRRLGGGCLPDGGATGLHRPPHGGRPADHPRPPAHGGRPPRTPTPAPVPTVAWPRWWSCLWLTDDLRVAEPEPLDEARNARLLLRRTRTLGRWSRFGAMEAGPERRRLRRPTRARCH